MIIGFKPIPGQGIRLVLQDGSTNHIETIPALGWCLLSYDRNRLRDIMDALEHSGMTQSSFIAQAVESYLFSIEHAACFPELHNGLTKPVGGN